MQLATQLDEVELRLESWGQVFALWKDEVMASQFGENVLYRMMRIGVMSTATPFELDTEAMQVEDAVRELYKADPLPAIVLRAYYCGSGRKGQERYERALDLARQLVGRRFSRRSYYLYREVGKEAVARAISVAPAPRIRPLLHKSP